MLHQGAGTSLAYELDLPSFQLAHDLDLAYLRGELRFTRTSEGLYLEGRLATELELECDRCLTGFTEELSIKPGELLFYPARAGADSVPATGVVDLGPLFREHLLLGVPTQPLCRADCRGLCPECGGDLNLADCEHPHAEFDPRFAALKSLLPES